MTVLSIYRPINDDTYEPNESVLFFDAAYAGGNVIPCVVSINKLDLEEYNVPTFYTYNEAYKHAFIITFGELSWKQEQAL